MSCMKYCLTVEQFHTLAVGGKTIFKCVIVPAYLDGVIIVSNYSQPPGGSSLYLSVSFPADNVCLQRLAN